VCSYVIIIVKYKIGIPPAAPGDNMSRRSLYCGHYIITIEGCIDDLMNAKNQIFLKIVYLYYRKIT
jgi:hypothetical protein